MMQSFQVENIEQFLVWVKTCPCHYTISSMQGGYIHVKFLIPNEPTGGQDVSSN